MGTKGQKSRLVSTTSSLNAADGEIVEYHTKKYHSAIHQGSDVLASCRCTERGSLIDVLMTKFCQNLARAKKK